MTSITSSVVVPAPNVMGPAPPFRPHLPNALTSTGSQLVRPSRGHHRREWRGPWRATGGIAHGPEVVGRRTWSATSAGRGFRTSRGSNLSPQSLTTPFRSRRPSHRCSVVTTSSTNRSTLANLLHIRAIGATSKRRLATEDRIGCQSSSAVIPVRGPRQICRDAPARGSVRGHRRSAVLIAHTER